MSSFLKSVNNTNPFSGGSPAERAGAVRMLLAACALTIALYFIPYAGYATYPLRLLVTFIHEGSHALMCLLTGGMVRSIAIEPDGSGLTQTLGGFGPLISSAGYLGATLYGALLIGLLRRGVGGRPLLLATGVCVGLATLGVLGGLAAFSFNIFGLLWGVALTAALVFAGLRLSPAVAGWVVAFIGVQCALNALFDLRTLFTLSVTSATPTDAMNMQRMTWIPAPVWATLWIITALALLWYVLRSGRRVALR